MNITKEVLSRMEEVLKENNGKLTPTFINEILHHTDTKVTHAQLTPNTRVCVITLPTGHELVGYSQVLNAENDVELIGQGIAYRKAAENIWSVFGSIAKVLV